MISAFRNSLRVPELRERIFFTLAMVAIVRIGANITLPGVDAEVLQSWIANAKNQDSGVAGIASLFNIFSGGALTNCAVFALGIMPYISASIGMQLLTAIHPPLNKLSREEGGRQKINQYTRILTIFLCIIQGGLIARGLLSPRENIFLRGLVGEGILVPEPGVAFMFTAVIIMTAGTMTMMWLGDQITERGIGNGISLVIAVNIVASLPGALVQVWQNFVVGAGEDGRMRPVILVMLVAFFFLVIAAVIAVTEAYRRVTIQYAKRVSGRRTYGGTQYMPLKVNYANVMPIIFAQAILLFPATILGMLFPESEFVQKFSANLAGGWMRYLVTALMIFFFSYFWVAIMFQANQIAEDLKRNGGYIPGLRPGQPTAEFLDKTMSRLTFAGAIFLIVIAILPEALSRYMRVPPIPAQFFGGTSLLILVGVLLDIMRQIETHLIQRNYDGFLRKGKIRGGYKRTRNIQAQSGGSSIWLYVVIGIVVILGMAYYLISKG